MIITFTEVYFNLENNKDRVNCMNKDGKFLLSIAYTEGTTKQRNLLMSVWEQYPNSDKTVRCRIITSNNVHDITIAGKRYYSKFVVKYGYLSFAQSGSV